MNSYTEFVQCTFVVVHVAAIAGNFYHAHFMQINFIGKAGKIILVLGVVIAHSDNFFAACFKTFQRLADFVELADAAAEQTAWLQHQQSDTFVLFGVINRSNYVTDQRFTFLRIFIGQ